jgi:hypothetical protein
VGTLLKKDFPGDALQVRFHDILIKEHPAETEGGRKGRSGWEKLLIRSSFLNNVPKPSIGGINIHIRGSSTVIVSARVSPNREWISKSGGKSTNGKW